MALPSINQYIISVADSYGLLRTIRDFSPHRDRYGDPVFISGNFSAVFKADTADGTIAMKCYTREIPCLRERFEFIKMLDSAYLVHVSYLPGELFIFSNKTECYPVDVNVAPWIEGNTLLRELRRLCGSNDTKSLSKLAADFDGMAHWLLGKDFAHGDLKHDNILVDESGRLHLIDFDGMYFPGLDGMKSPTTGSPAYQHPKRDENYFNSHIDDFPLALISLSLHALADDPSLLKSYNDSENIIINACEIESGRSEAFEKLCAKYESSSHEELSSLCRLLKSPCPKLDGIADIFRNMVLKNR